MTPVDRCPFCGDELRRGWLMARGVLAAAGFSGGAVAVTFETDDGTGEGSLVFEPGRRGRGRRPARCCVACEAVVVDPKPPAGSA